MSSAGVPFDTPPRNIVRRRSPPGFSAVRADWTQEGERCYSLTFASADSVVVHPLLDPAFIPDRTRALCMSLRGDASQRPGCGPAAPPRFRSAGRAFTVTVPTSDIPCHSQAPTRRLHCFRPPAAALRASSACKVGFTCRVRVVPPSPLNERVILPLKRGWRNDSGCLPSCQISCQLALSLKAFQLQGPDVLRRQTRPNIMPPL